MKILKNNSHIGFFWLAGLLANASGWLFALIANRSLSLADMGNLSLLVNTITIASIASLSIAIATNTFGSLNNSNAKWITAAFGRLAFLFGVIISIIFLVSSPWWRHYLNFSDSYMVLVLSAIVLFLMFPLSWLRGALQAKLSLVLVGVGLIIEALSKIVIASYSINKSNSLEIVVASIVGASLITIIFYVFAEAISLFKDLSLPGRLEKKHWTFLIKVMVARIGVISLITVDIFFAKKYLSPDQAGIYALLSLVGKAIFFVMQSFYLLITPIIAPALENAQLRKRAITNVLFGAVILISSLIGSYLMFPRFTIGVLLGDRYALIMPYVLSYSIANGILSIALLISLYKMLRGQFIFTMLVIGTLIVEVFLMITFNESIEQIAENVLISSVVLACSAVITFLMMKKNQLK
jgi:O-antigen/teichoic acid export membrane protein